MRMNKINFYFDFLSPYSYFAWINHKTALEGLDVEFEYRPVLMGRLFSHFEFKGPGEIGVKRKYELKNCFRYASLNNLTFSPPSTHPFNPMAIIRMATVAANSNKDSQVDVIDFIFKSIWQKGMVLEDPEVIEQLFNSSSLSVDVYEASFSREAKIELKSNIKEAISCEIFGVPTFKTGDDIFWGNDSLIHLRNHLLGEDNWDKNLYNKLLGL